MSEQLFDHERFCKIEAHLQELDRRAYPLLKKEFTVQSVCFLTTSKLDDAQYVLQDLQSDTEKFLYLVRQCVQAVE